MNKEKAFRNIAFIILLFICLSILLKPSFAPIGGGSQEEQGNNNGSSAGNNGGNGNNVGGGSQEEQGKPGESEQGASSTPSPTPTPTPQSCTPSCSCDGDVRVCVDEQCNESRVNCPNGCVNGECVETHCEEGWVCIDSHNRAFQKKDCSLEQEEFCENGCVNGLLDSALAGAFLVGFSGDLIAAEKSALNAESLLEMLPRAKKVCEEF